MARYGTVDIIWWDYSKGEAEGEFWGANELMAMVRKYQPRIIRNNRLYRTDAYKKSALDGLNAHRAEFGDFTTLAKVAGVPAPEGLPGIDLLDEDARKERKTIFGSIHATHNISLENPDDTLQYLWCIQDRWKLLVRHDGIDSTMYAKIHDWDKASVRLYDLENDPHELDDISAAHPEVVERLRNKIEVWHPVKQ